MPRYRLQGIDLDKVMQRVEVEAESIAAARRIGEEREMIVLSVIPLDEAEGTFWRVPLQLTGIAALVAGAIMILVGVADARGSGGFWLAYAGGWMIIGGLLLRAADAILGHLERAEARATGRHVDT